MIFLFYRRPIGKYHVQVCTTTPCWLRGSDAVLNAIKEATGCEVGGNSPCGKFSVSEVYGYCFSCTLFDQLFIEFGSRVW